MGRCKVCSSDLVKQVDKALVEGRTLQSIADETGFHVSTICRHKPHVADKIKQNAALTELQQGLPLLQKVEGLLQRAENLLDKAESSGDLRVATAALREVRQTLELLGKASGELAPERILIQFGPIIEQLVVILRQEIHDSETLRRISERMTTIDI